MPEEKETTQPGEQINLSDGVAWRRRGDWGLDGRAVADRLAAPSTVNKSQLSWVSRNVGRGSRVVRWLDHWRPAVGRLRRLGGGHFRDDALDSWSFQDLAFRQCDSASLPLAAAFKPLDVLRLRRKVPADGGSRPDLLCSWLGQVQRSECWGCWLLAALLPTDAHRRLPRQQPFRS